MITQVENMNTNWFETRNYVENLVKNVEKNYMHRKAYEELATLRDVHEGYQRYINTAEALSDEDSQKLSLQLETNKVNYNFF